MQDKLFPQEVVCASRVCMSAGGLGCARLPGAVLASLTFPPPETRLRLSGYVVQART